MKLKLYAFFICTFYVFFLQAQQIAFPTADGMGKFATGGRGTITIPTTVFEVTNLNDDGAVGSLRYAVNTTATYRTIVFRVSGTIHLTSKLNIKANTTIAGQTAPGDGICLADYPVALSGNNIIVRFIRFRMGDKNELITSPAGCGVPVTPFSASCMPVNGSGGNDAFGGTGYKNIVIDHCNMSWSTDESCSIYRGDSTSVQWCLMSEPLNFSYHFETGDTDFERHGYGGIWGGQHVSFHHNVLAHCQGRNPRFDGSRNLGDGATVGLENVDFVNNVIYNWGGYTTNGGEGGNYNIVNNYYKYGPNTSTGSSSGVGVRYMIINPYKQTSPVLPWGKYFLSGNFVDGSTANTNNNWSGAAMSGGSLADTVSSKVTTPFSFLSINTHTATTAYNLILDKGGCYLPKRDTLDKRIMANIINRTGAIIDCQGGYPHATPYAQTVNAWPTLTSLTAPLDTDHDGMPDAWENARGLNPTSAADRNIYNVNGYTNLENYLNGDSIVASNTVNTCVTTKTFNFKNTNDWLHLYDSTTSITNAIDTTTLIASIKDVATTGTAIAAYYTTNTSRLYNGKAYLNRNITLNNSSTANTVRVYFSTAEFNALKAADASIASITDLKIYRSASTTCLTQIDAIVETINPTTTGNFGTYGNGYYIEFTTTNSGTFFIAGTNLVTAIAPIATDKNVKIYPNPVKNILTVQSKYDNTLIIQILDSYGKIVVENTQIKKGVNSIKVSHLQAATYWVKLINQKNILISKLIKL